MNYKILSAFALLGATTLAAHAQTFLGTVDLYYLHEGSTDGPFEWSTGPGGTGIDVYTYCFSTVNAFAPWQNPQVYDVYSMAGATAGSAYLASLLAGNGQPGLTTTTFLEAAAQAVALGTPDPYWNHVPENDAIHFTESNGGYSATTDYSDFWYLIPDDPSSYSYGGQPQGYIVTGGGFNTTPGPFAALPMVFGFGGLALRRRNKRA